MINLQEIHLGKTKVMFNNTVCVFTTLQWIPANHPKIIPNSEYQVALMDLKSAQIDYSGQVDPDHFTTYTGIMDWGNIKDRVHPYPNSAKFITSDTSS